jgi:hypothetical protein
MKKTLILTESELIKVVNRIVESYSDDTYDDEDYVEVFLHYFRPWIRANHGDEIGEYPLSFLVKKYISEFAEANGIRPEEVIYSYRNNLTNASNFGKRLVRMGKHKLPSLRSQEKFTDRYKKPLEFFVAQLGLPEFIKLNFIEKTPFNVEVQILIDWEGLIKHQGEETFNTDRIKKEIKDKIQGFLGVEFGNPVHGQLKLEFGRPDFIGVDEWVKQSLNKKIKKEIKTLPNSRVLHAIRFETLGSSTIGGELKLSFKSWSGRNDFIKNVKELLQSMGYNTNILKVVH